MAENQTKILSISDAPSTAGTQAPAAKAFPLNDSSISSKYPQLSYLTSDPEIAPILAQAESESWTAERFQAAIMATSWWRNNSSSARRYYNEQHTDPASFQRHIWDTSDTLLQIIGDQGYDVSPEYLDYFAQKAYKQGLSPAQMKVMLAEEIVPLAGVTEKNPIIHQMREIEQQYQIAIDGPTQQYWLGALTSGRSSIENFRGAIIAQAKALFPNLTAQFEQGQTFKQIIEPYRRQIANYLELDPEKVDFVGNPKWRNVVDYVDPKDGTHRSMSNQELSRYVKNMDEYWQTTNGKNEAGDMVEGILSDFGVVKR